MTEEHKIELKLKSKCKKCKKPYICFNELLIPIGKKKFYKCGCNDVEPIIKIVKF